MDMPYKDLVQRRKYGREWAKNKNIEYRDEALNLVGRFCVRCGIDDPRVLEFDHIIPILRRTSGDDSGKMLARDIVRGRVDPKLLQTLCSNCHTIKTYYPKEF